MGVKKQTNKDFESKVFNKYGSKIDILSEYNGKNVYINYVYHCHEHGDVFKRALPQSILGTKFNPCEKCSTLKRVKMHSKLDVDYFINNMIFNASEFGGTLLSTEWKGTDKKYLFKCNNQSHEPFYKGYKYITGTNKSWCTQCSGKAKDFNKEINDIIVGKNGELITNYIGAYDYVKVRCLKHDYVWDITPTNIKKGNWCYVCSMPKIEKVFYDMLLKTNLNIIPQYKVKELKGENNQPFRFDFGIEKSGRLIMLIEIDGREHDYKKFPDSKRGEQRRKAQSRDIIKDEFCKMNNIILIRIKVPYFLKEQDYNNAFKYLNEQFLYSVNKTYPEIYKEIENNMKNKENK